MALGCEVKCQRFDVEGEAASSRAGFFLSGGFLEFPKRIYVELSQTGAALSPRIPLLCLIQAEL